MPGSGLNIVRQLSRWRAAHTWSTLDNPATRIGRSQKVGGLITRRWSSVRS
jgi:hypothetical protein